ncbi:ras-related protein Rab-4B isoform X2 [Schistocerca nitens]|uniref:ras-related protein Rab-4B isoform X2 n=1 Tax=Schistocerca nitens TaxID=7011 RepID=UPI0021173A97|nr:ras-related protein Rab-4B isoform X2 [Schistocerca nitens]
MFHTFWLAGRHGSAPVGAATWLPLCAASLDEREKFSMLLQAASRWPRRVRSVTRSYYRGAAGALLVYDITNRDSFNALADWLSDARSLASPNIVILLVGNKKDLDAEREVTFLEASCFAQENELMFLETSARTGENVEEAFLKCSKSILAKIETGEVDPERIGSGIQFGDSTTRRLHRESNRRPPDCICRM